ncbi:MAG: NAD(P)/FAD-dependent oxidoreductase [Gemmatimonadota bacterium]
MIKATGNFDAAGEATWDALVIGAGPAGALAARQLAQAGVRVLLVERNAFPRWKVCSACLNGQALSVLDAVGLETLVPSLGAIALKEFRLSLAGRSTWLPLPVGAALSRARLDSALVEAAMAAGAHFLPEPRALVEAIEAGTRRVPLVHHGRKVVAPPASCWRPAAWAIGVWSTSRSCGPGPRRGRASAPVATSRPSRTSTGRRRSSWPSGGAVTSAWSVWRTAA